MIIFTHISAALLLAAFLNIYSEPLALFALILGAMLPDADYPFSFIGKILQPWSFKLHEEFGHRTITHSVIPLLALFAIYLATKESLALYLATGMLSHIFLDMFTIQGVKLLFPLRTNFVLLDGMVETNSRADFVIAVALDVLTILVIVFREHIFSLIS